MRYAPVVPPNCIEQLKGMKLKAYFCYADSAYFDHTYREFFIDLPGDRYIVLDCPIVEHGRLLTPQEYANVVQYIEPTMAIVPDAQFDRLETMRMFDRYYSACSDPSMAGVPQGKNMPDMIQCARFMYDAGVRRMGIIRTRNIEGQPKRSEIIRELGYTDVKYHLLGAEFPYIDESWCAHLRLADSCDSAEPINAAIRGLNMVTSHGDRSRFARPAEFMQISYIDTRMLKRNIQRMQKWLTGPAIPPESSAKDRFRVISS